MKLVTHCRTEWPEYEQYVLQEYAVYRVFNELSSKSFRVRLMHVTYVDTSGRIPTITRNGFVIEHENHVAERHGYAAFDTEHDLASVVGVHYADQHPRLGQTSLRHMLFRDFCRTESEIEPLLERFRDRRTAIYELYENIPGMEPEQVRRVHRTFDAFYRTIDDPHARDREFLRPCRVSPQ